MARGRPDKRKRGTGDAIPRKKEKRGTKDPKALESKRLIN